MTFRINPGLENYQKLVEMFKDPQFIETYSVVQEDKKVVVKETEEKFHEVLKFFGNKEGTDGYFFSNFSPHPVKAYGQTWPTTEHLFQALKFKATDPEYFNTFSKLDTPKKAKGHGRSRAHILRPDWEQVKDEVMHWIL